ncbi:MAG: deoxyguanosinetriphosphate triphosphohydrolase [Tissierellia bacterium]|nr:deoxyguanosinetriphosphate triphosphohydrolase [Tissierellia bacterium]
MNLRTRWEGIEESILSPHAVKARDSRGRREWEKEDPLRTCFQRDRDRIIHSKAFRRLKHKTQVFLSPEEDHYRTRLTHTLEVAQIARTIARGLALNEDLTEAIAMGHDLGHTPYGHTGEKVLNSLNPKGFKHNEHSLRVVDLLEPRSKGPGLNLTWEVRDGILCHTGGLQAQTLEGRVIKFADRIAYINHDIDDAIRAGVLSLEDIPLEISKVLGSSHSERITRMVMSVIESSAGTDDITMDGEIGGAMRELRAFMFRRVYFNPEVKGEDEKVQRMMAELYHIFSEDVERLPEHVLREAELRGDDVDTMITDYIAGMTDNYAVSLWKELFVPGFWTGGQ